MSGAMLLDKCEKCAGSLIEDVDQLFAFGGSGLPGVFDDFVEFAQEIEVAVFFDGAEF